jgi:hypothetical protein
MRCPNLIPTGPESYRIQFWSLKQYLAEFASIFGLCALLTGWMALQTSAVVFLLPLSVVAFGYYWAGARMKNLSQRRSLELRGRELWAGTPELERIGRISEVVSVELSGAEDEWRTENGSTRIYLKLADCEPGYSTFPLLISQVTLKKVGAQIAAVTAVLQAAIANPSEASKEAVAPAASGWEKSRRDLRTPIHPGAGEWRRAR